MWQWKGGPWRVPRPSRVSGTLALALALLGAAITPAWAVLEAQDPMRPWLPWRTLHTRQFRFHFPAPLEGWTRQVAARADRVDSALAAMVGYAPERPVHVVVHDPFGVSNGYVLPMIEQPTTVWWATPPDPRNDIGNFTTWGELIAVHELAHVAHLTRPSRNPLQRAIWNSLPTNIGPIARNAPRWLYEGYATYLEGRLTGSGRPNNAWRSALLRQWAIEGRLPGYAALNGADTFQGGAFAYLGGSAFLEWLTEREGDSTLVHLWRRMTARQQRGFEGAFRGLYGESPSALYGRHVAELTRDAMAARDTLARAGLVEGELLQRLAWETGDPAISSDGARVALVLRDRVTPARVVVWSTAEEPEDTAAIRRRLEALTKDPQDVPDRRFHPRPRKALKTLPALNGRAFLHPRWFPDNRRIVLTRWTPRPDGSVTPDLWVWDTETGEVGQVTRGAGAMHADVAASGSEAVATRCARGHCDIVRVDLARGTVRVLLPGSPERSWYRPRLSPDGRHFAVSTTEGGRWRIAVADREGTALRIVDADDGANRFDATWLAADSLVVVSDAGGIANLEVIAIESGATHTLTRVTGAAVAPERNPADSSIWFLDLHAGGFDLRRLGNTTPAPGPVVLVDADRFGFAGTRRVTARTIPGDSLGASRAYGLGPRVQRWLPGAHVSGDGAGGMLTVFSGDVVGRLNALVLGTYGQRGTMQGGMLRASLRRARPALEIGVHGFLHEPSMGRLPQPRTDSIDAAVFQGVFAASAFRIGDWWSATGRVGGSAGSVTPQRQEGTHFRGLGFAEITASFVQGRGGRALVQRLSIQSVQGHTRAPYQRAVGGLLLETSGREIPAVQLRGTFGRLVGSPHPFERFTIGGTASPLGDSAAMNQRYAMPMLPTGVASGTVLMTWRAALPSAGWTAYVEGASASDSLYGRRAWHRVAGLEIRADVPPIPVAFSPRVRGRIGAAYMLDAPFRRTVRGYLSMQLEP